MLSKNQVKNIHSLRMGKFRDEKRAFTVEGVKMVDDLLKSGFRIHQILGTRSWISSNQKHITEKSIEFHEVTDQELEKISNLVTPNEVFAVAGYPKNDIPDKEDMGNIILVLDSIQDPGNLGTIIRTADWFGIENVFCTPETADIFSPKVVQATMGSVFRVNVFYTEMLEFLSGLGKPWSIYGTVMDGESIYSTEKEFPAAIVIGNESKGISPGLYPVLNHKIGIPGGSSGAESLNAAVAAGLVMAEFSKQAF